MNKPVDIRPHLTQVGEGFHFDPDDILEQVKGQGFQKLVIIGEYPDDRPNWVSGNCNAGETIILMELAKHDIIFGDDDD